MGTLHRAVLAAALVVGFAPAAGAGADPADPALFTADGYRAGDFRSPTGTRPPEGARTVDTDTLVRLLDAGALAVDVLPTPPRPATLREGSLWLPPERRDIPGSLWLPDLGLPALSPAREARFRAELAPHAARTLVAYCLVDCWLSWNAARRLVAWGFADVRWYPEGTEGWTAAGHPTAPATPAVRPEAFR